MRNVTSELRNYLETQATETEKQMILTILRHPKQATEMNVRELSASGYCSSATLIRICQKLGFKGYGEFRLALCEEIGYQNSRHFSNYDEKQDSVTMVGEVLKESITALRQIWKLMDYRTLEAVVRRLEQTPLVHLYGIGASYLVVEDFMQKLTRIQKPVLLFHDLHLQLVDAGNVRPGDLCLIASYTGQTEEMIKVARMVHEAGGVLVVITQYSPNELSRLADYVFYVPRIEEEIRVGAGSSRISMLAMIDIIYRRFLASNYEKDYERILKSSQTLEKAKVEMPDAELDLDKVLTNDME